MFDAPVFLHYTELCSVWSLLDQSENPLQPTDDKRKTQGAKRNKSISFLLADPHLSLPNRTQCSISQDGWNH